ncbi:MAG: hypothetical protein QM778_28635 [Myxococcales bacterium]
MRLADIVALPPVLLLTIGGCGDGKPFTGNGDDLDARVEELDARVAERDDLDGSATLEDAAVTSPEGAVHTPYDDPDAAAARAVRRQAFDGFALAFAERICDSYAPCCGAQNAILDRQGCVDLWSRSETYVIEPLFQLGATIHESAVPACLDAVGASAAGCTEFKTPCTCVPVFDVSGAAVSGPPGPCVGTSGLVSYQLSNQCKQSDAGGP